MKLLLIPLLLVAACHAELEYTAAVVERLALTPAPGVLPVEQMLQNLAVYEWYLKNAVDNNAQIVVFPEFALGGSFSNRSALLPYMEDIPDAGDDIIPCNDTALADRPILVRASCLAQQYNVTVVMNLYDIKQCEGQEGCPADGRYQFNTEVAFSEQGVLIARYHKNHPWFTSAFDKPPKTEVVSFTTSFGVTFGMIVCFDLMFPDPADTLISQGVQNFPYSVAANIPFFEKALASIWSWVHNTNLLVSNLSPSSGGLYSKGVDITGKTLINFSDNGTLYIATVPANI